MKKNLHQIPEFVVKYSDGYGDNSKEILMKIFSAVVNVAERSSNMKNYSFEFNSTKDTSKFIYKNKGFLNPIDLETLIREIDGISNDIDIEMRSGEGLILIIPRDVIYQHNSSSQTNIYKRKVMEFEKRIREQNSDEFVTAFNQIVLGEVKVVQKTLIRELISDLFSIEPHSFINADFTTTDEGNSIRLKIGLKCDIVNVRAIHFVGAIHSNFVNRITFNVSDMNCHFVIKKLNKRKRIKEDYEEEGNLIFKKRRKRR